MVGVDGSESSQRALAFALDEARLRGWEVEVLHAWSYTTMTFSPFTPTANIGGADIEAAGSEILDRVLAAAETSGATVTRRLVMDASAAHALLEAAAAAGLLVLGTRGHGPVADLLLGSTSEHCAHHPPCPIVIVP